MFGKRKPVQTTTELPLMHFWFRNGSTGVVVKARNAQLALVELRAETSASWAREAFLFDITEID